jgi:multiple antibiotic resistance protein
MRRAGELGRNRLSASPWYRLRVPGSSLNRCKKLPQQPVGAVDIPRCSDAHAHLDDTQPMTQASNYLHIFTALFVIVNPIGAIPLFITYTRGQSAIERRIAARTAALAVAIVLVLSVFLGDQLLQLFGIGIPSFRVGGGILILLMAISMLNAQQGGARYTPEEGREGEEKNNIAVVPLAIPILAGPGAISTTIIYAHNAHSIIDYVALLTAALLVAGGVATALYLADQIAERIGRTGINIATRIMGLILAAVAVEFIADGLGQLFPKLH